ncbi:hypothetical protein I4U23_015711 [Adineta vaga]|nr:hypothetical protein I4U23_015711 [Adineta vaga]
MADKTGIILNLFTLGFGDFYQFNFDSSSCIMSGYFSLIFINALYYSFVNQAFFRFCRIVYSTHRWLQFSWIYIIIPLLQLILIAIVYCPYFIWHAVIYLRKEYYCFIDYASIRSVIWLILNIYGIPLCLLMMIYLRIVLFLRRQPINSTWMIKQRQQRDLIVIRRIFVIISLLVILGIPTIVLLLMLYITGEIHPLFHRYAWFFVNISMMGLTMIMVVLTPQLKNVVFKKFHQNQVVPINESLTNANPVRQIISTF